MSQRGSSKTRSTRRQTPESHSKQSERPPSPVMVTRVAEKRELANLNDRLAYYINHVRNLETDNSHLIKEVQTLEEVKVREVSNIKSLYETELSDARKLLDKVSKEKAVLQIENSKLNHDNDDYKSRMASILHDLKQTEKKLLHSQVTNNDLQARLADAISNNKQWEVELIRLRREQEHSEKNLQKLHHQLEQETVLRVDMENNLQTLREESTFNKQLHIVELNESRTTRSVSEFETVDGKRDDYIAKLQIEMDKMRRENDAKIKQTRDETESYFVKKLAAMQTTTPRKDLMDNSQKELLSSRKVIEELQSQITQYLNQATNNQSRINELEALIKSDRFEYSECISRKDSELEHLRGLMQEQILEYRDLLDIKVQLDLELVAYRKLLEGEESRLNISTPGRPRRKRKRIDIDDTISDLRSTTTNKHTVSCASNGTLSIINIDTEGGHVKIENVTDKDIGLGGYSLKVLSDDQDVTYKFNTKLQIKAGTSTTVYSSNSDMTHNPPSVLVMKTGHNWPSADKLKCLLLDSSNTEIAVREISLKEYTDIEQLEDDEDEFDEEDKNKCLLM